jgi:hypothetical protein
MTPILREASGSPYFHKNIIVEHTLQQSTVVLRSEPKGMRRRKAKSNMRRKSAAVTWRVVSFHVV